MSLEIGLLVEGLATHGTCEGFLACVDLPVSGEVVTSSEGLATHITRVTTPTIRGLVMPTTACSHRLVVLGPTRQHPLKETWQGVVLRLSYSGFSGIPISRHIHNSPAAKCDLFIACHMTDRF